MNKMRNFPEFTHFACIPFITQQQRSIIIELQNSIKKIYGPIYSDKQFRESNHKLAHITISMLVLHREQVRMKIQSIMQKIEKELEQLLSGMVITFSKVGYFSRLNTKTKQKEVTLLYLQIKKDENFKKLEIITDKFIRQLMKNQIIISSQLKQMRIKYDHNTNLYSNEQSHLTLFRVSGVSEDEKFYAIYDQISQLKCQNAFLCLSFDISTRNSYDYNNSFYNPFYSIDNPSVKIKYDKIQPPQKEQSISEKKQSEHIIQEQK